MDEHEGVRGSIQYSEDPYKFDLDKNGFPALTEKNVKLINLIIETDSNYRYDSDPQNPRATISVVNRYKKTKNLKQIIEIVTCIDKQNSTHQASEGRNGGGQGREKTAAAIQQIDDFYTLLEKGDPTLVNLLAEKSIPTRFTFSFASKYCTFVARYLYDSDEYSIYDRVLSDILPYYAWVYGGEDHTFKSKGKVKSKIAKEFAEKGTCNYKGYRDLVDSIRHNSAEITGYIISRKDFDHLLWYYFKGDSDIVDKATGISYGSRTTRALECVGKAESSYCEVSDKQ